MEVTVKGVLNIVLILAGAVFVGCSTARGQGSQMVRYPTMLDMTFPEFEAAVKKTDIVLLPIGAIEEHSWHLPLGTDAMNAVAQLFEVQEYLRKGGVDTILGPSLNIGITNEADDWARDGTYVYPGSLTISKGTFVALYLDVLRSLYENGLHRAFLYVGHLERVMSKPSVQIAEEANRRIHGMAVYALVDSEMLERMKRPPSTHILSVEKGRNFERVAQLLGSGSEMPRTTHCRWCRDELDPSFLPGGRAPRLRTISPIAFVCPSSRSCEPETDRRTRAAAVGSHLRRPRRLSASRSWSTRRGASATQFCRC
jgi:hypothetical protein